MKSDIYIHDCKAVSAKRDDLACHNFTKIKYLNQEVYAGKIQPEKESRLQSFLNENSNYKKQDRSIQLALYISDLLNLDSAKSKKNIGVNFSSSRGATQFWERQHNKFIQEKTLSPRTSPYTTLGNLSSIIAKHLGQNGLSFSHSMACTGFALGLLNGIAWLRSGMLNDIIIGGAEAPLTDFTIAQFQALKIYSNSDENYPCLAGLKGKAQNSMILGEAAVGAYLSKDKNGAQAEIIGIGYAMESLSNPAGISQDARHMEAAMKMALKEADLKEVDIIITHTPGTKKGDDAELNAITNVFKNCPVLTNNKWKVGHSFAASSGLSLAYALEILKKQKVTQPTYLINDIKIQKFNKIMINSAGFGGQAVSFIIEPV